MRRPNSLHPILHPLQAPLCQKATWGVLGTASLPSSMAAAVAIARLSTSGRRARPCNGLPPAPAGLCAVWSFGCDDGMHAGPPPCNAPVNLHSGLRGGGAAAARWRCAMWRHASQHSQLGGLPSRAQARAPCLAADQCWFETGKPTQGAGASGPTCSGCGRRQKSRSCTIRHRAPNCADGACTAGVTLHPATLQPCAGLPAWTQFHKSTAGVFRVQRTSCSGLSACRPRPAAPAAALHAPLRCCSQPALPTAAL